MSDRCRVTVLEDPYEKYNSIQSHEVKYNIAISKYNSIQSHEVKYNIAISKYNSIQSHKVKYNIAISKWGPGGCQLPMGEINCRVK